MLEISYLSKLGIKMEIQTPKGKRKIGPGEKVFIIAELSGNHNGEYERALKLVDHAIEAGADAIKIQTYTADTMTIDCDNEYFQVKTENVWKNKTLYELYQWAYTPWEWQPKLKKYAEDKGVMLFSTPFDETSVDFLEEMNVELYKVASFETGDIPLLKKIGKTQKPVIISRGMTSKEELEFAVKTLKENGTPEVIVLHCVSSYPAPIEQMNISTIKDINERLGVPTGLSDHSLDNSAAIIAVAQGATIIEKHMTLKREDGGPDAGFSLEPHEFKDLVDEIRKTETILGKPMYELVKNEKDNANFKRSIFVVKDMEEGEEFTKENIRVIRPGHGLKPIYYENIIGKTASDALKRGTPLKQEMVKEE